MARVDAGRLTAVVPDLEPFLSTYEQELLKGGYCDRAMVFGFASEAAKNGSHRLVSLPALLLDVPIASQAEMAFAEALAGRTDCLALVPAADATTLGFFRQEQA